MAEPRSRGPKLYHERRDGSTPSAVHCVNALLQGPLFSESDLAAVAIELDLLQEFGLSTYSSGHFRFDGFGVQILQEALKTRDIQITPNAREAPIDFERESALICHNDYKEDWTCVRKVDGKWYEFDCLRAAPEYLPDFYLPAYVDSLECFGWTIYLVKGKLPGAGNLSAGQACGDDGPPSPHEDDVEIIGIVNACNAMRA